MKRFWVGLAVVLMVGAGAVWAQQQPEAAPVDVAPGVARVSLISGEASTQRGDSGDWVAATLNTPVVAGDRVSTGNEGRLELQLDGANVVRLAGATTLKVANLDRNQIQVQVGRGLVTYAVLPDTEASVEIDTPNLAVHPISQGDYRILVNSDDETQVIVREGAADVSTPQGSTRVQAGEMITVRGTDNPQYQTAAAPGRDEWDKWNSERDRKISDAQSWAHTDRYYTGSADLDAYGSWSEVPDYDYVWFPNVASGWAPYRDGRWVWEPYWGWTWVSYEPWGWAPYHYGRWALYGGRWGWWPGPVYGYRRYYPVWAPAYVSFFGFGFGGGGWSFGFSFGWGNVGWLPLGPGDYFHPWWGRWGRGFRFEHFHDHDGFHHDHDGWGPIWHGHGHGISNLELAGRDEHVRRGISSMPGDQFGRGRVPVGQHGVDAAQFRQAGMLTGAVPVTPTRESLRVSDRPANPATMHDGSQRFFTRSQPGGAPVPFHQEAAQMQRVIDAARGQKGVMGPPAGGIGTQPNAGGRPGTAAPPTQEWRSGSSGAPVAGKGGYQPPSPRTPYNPTEPAGRSGGGWHTFTPSTGQPQGGSPAGKGGYQPPSPRTPYNPTEPAGRGYSSGGRQGGGWHSFTPPAGQPQGGSPAGKGGYQPPSPRTPYNPSEPAGRSGGGWQPAPRSPYTPSEPSRGGWQSSAPRSTPSYSPPAGRSTYGGGSWGGSRSGGSRPPLNMQQPIVQPRGGYSGSSGGSRGGSSGGSYHGGSSGGGSHSSGGHSGGGGGGRHR